MTSLNTTLNTLKNLKEEINKNNKNNISHFKLLKKAVFKSNLPIDKNLNKDSLLLDLASDIELIDTFNILETAEDIQSIYDNDSYGKSCMSLDGCYSARGRMVGRFYNKYNIKLAIIDGARALINPINNSFYKVYGENWYILKALLSLLGFKNTDTWLTNLKIQVHSTIKRIRICEEKIKYIEKLKDDDKIYVYFSYGRERVYIKNMKLDVSINYNNNLYLERDKEIYKIYYNNENKKFFIYENNFSYTYEEVFDENNLPYLDGSGYKYNYIYTQAIKEYKKLLMKIDLNKKEEKEQIEPKIRAKHLAKYLAKCRTKNKKCKY